MATTDSSLLDLEKKLIERQEKIEKEREELDHEKKEIAKKKEEYIEKLQKTSGLTTEEATRELISEIEEKYTQTLEKIIKEAGFKIIEKKLTHFGMEVTFNLKK
ncbi:MAG: hypothetical protein AAB922_06885 [Patescibacteria group bacterium]